MLPSHFGRRTIPLDVRKKSLTTTGAACLAVALVLLAGLVSNYSQNLSYANLLLAAMFGSAALASGLGLLTVLCEP
jgi:hypothetical protein